MGKGSPPPTRGTHHLYHPCQSDRGITPAYAGNTLFCSDCELLFWDHPRLRGEHHLWLLFQRSLLGSPPPTRGTRSFVTSKRIESGITPAYAGNTKHKFKSNTKFRDHPRLRGEHAGIQIHQTQIPGSPPPTRGTRKEGGRSDGKDGITPAYAGNTPAWQGGGTVLWDHPRLRGEHRL